MDKKQISWIAGFVSLICVVIVSVWMWNSTTPSEISSDGMSNIQPLNLDAINKASVTEIESLQKNGELPIVLNPAEVGKTNPFIP